MIYLLLLVLLALGNTRSSSGTVRFDGGSTFRQIPLNHTDNPIVIYCISEINFNDSFSLTTSSNYLPSQYLDVLELRIVNTTINALTSISLKYFVSTKLKGWQDDHIKLTYEFPSTQITKSFTSPL